MKFGERSLFACRYGSTGLLESRHHINCIARLSSRWLEPRLERLGLAVAQVPVFRAIKNLGPLSQKMAKLLHVEQPTMAQLLTRMERDGLIGRRPDPADGRSSLIHVTSSALKKAQPARDLLLEGNRIYLRGFSANEIAMLKGLLERVRRNLEAAVEG
jgi:MarR family transcriptional regulator for hemolysin